MRRLGALRDRLDLTQRLPDQPPNPRQVFLLYARDIMHGPLYGKLDATKFVALHIYKPNRVSVDVDASE